MSELDLLFKDLNKKFKQDIGFKGLERLQYELIPFSSPRMNYILYGGLARNTLNEFFGDEGSGKTTSALDICKNAQIIFAKEKKNKKVIYIDVENTLDEVWAEKLGVNTEELYLVRPQEQTAEEIFDIAEAIVKSGDAGLLVIDSIAMLVPQQIYEESYTKKSYCGNSGSVTRFVSKIVPLLRTYDCTLLVINQVRDDMNNEWNDYVTPGGRALKHQCSTRLFFRKGKQFDADGKEVTSFYENPRGHQVNCRIIKSKICRNDRKLGYYTLNYLEGIDWVNDLIDVAIKFNYIEQKGAWYYVIDENGEVTNKYQGSLKLVEAIKQDEIFRDKLLKNINEEIKKLD